MRGELLLETKTFRAVRWRLEEACDEGAISLIYGPPSSEKSFALETHTKRFNAAGKPVIYLYCPPRCTLTHLYRAVADAADIPVTSSGRWACRRAVLLALRAMPTLPAIIFDEAQHLELDAFEGVRELNDLTKRPPERPRGCGIILAGSHTLYLDLNQPIRKAKLEQLLSRIPYRVQLTGMDEKEIVTLAERALGNGKPAQISAEQKKTLLEICRVIDPYFMDGGKPAPREYYSSRRLLEFIRQKKRGFRGAEEAA